MPAPRRFLVLLATLALFAAACGGTSEGAADENTTESAAAAEANGDSASGEVTPAVAVDSNSINGGKPSIEIPGGDAPTELLVDDLIPTDGRAAESGDLLVMQYVGVLHEDGSEFDSSWDLSLIHI